MKKIKNFFSKSLKKIKPFLNKKTLLYSIIFLLVFFITLSFFRKTTIKYYVSTADNYAYEKTSNKISGISTYTNVLIGYEEGNKKFINENIELTDSIFSGLIVDKANLEYGEMVLKYEKDSDVYLLTPSNPITIKLEGITSGVYYLNVDYYELDSSIDNNQISIKIRENEEKQFAPPFFESNTLVLKSRWLFSKEEFSKDRYGNEIQAGAEKEFVWQSQPIYDYNGFHNGYYGYYLEEGNEIEISSISNDLLIGEVSFVKQESIITYNDYLSIYKDENISSKIIEISARDMDVRSEPSIRLRNEQNANNLYYDTQYLLLNTIFGDSWRNGGQAITYKINASESGMYKLSVKYRQYTLSDMPVFRKVSIDGEVPFDLFESYGFPYTTGFINRRFVDENGKDVLIYLEKGEHTITLEAVNYPYRSAVEKIREIMTGIQELALKIKRYTTGGSDQLRDWDIEAFFPEAKPNMLKWAEELDELYLKLSKMSNIDKPSGVANLKQASKRLVKITKNINRLPTNMIQFSDGESSVNQLLGSTMQQLMVSGMELERVSVYGSTKLQNPRPNVFKGFYEEIKRLVLSYFNNPYSAAKASKKDLNVWVNHPRQYIEIMQALIDEKYDGNLKVTLSQMPDQNKLILANASGDAPDVAVGVDHWIPYEFAIREAALDLRTFDGYEELVKDFAKGAFIPYIFEDSVYGMPETQNFWITYYRKDTLSNIGIEEVPQTWDDVKAVLPKLQSYDLNYFIPISQFTGLKPYVATLPFIYQFGGSLFTEDGMQTAVNSPEILVGMRLMTELFTLYNMPKQVSSFYNQFRYGLIPIGVSDLSTYILLDTVALELEGLWDIDLHPGNYNEETGEIDRSAPVGGQASMIMSTTNHPKESWDFLSWWMSAEIQSEFAFILQNTYGKAYFWSSANLKAFETVSMPEKHKNIILKQWEYALEAPRIPGSYMIEREISNAWTKMVFDNANPRQALDEAVRISNREILYKMAEFGYVVNGEPVKDFMVPNKDNIDYWLKGAEK